MKKLPTKLKTYIRATDLIPSLLTSWVSWRNFYYVPGHGHEPFYGLMRDMGTDRMPTKNEYDAYYGLCPHCKGKGIITNIDYSTVTCICELLVQLKENVENIHAPLRTKVEKAYLDDIIYPREMGKIYKKTMGETISTVKAFIHKPDRWLLLIGKYGLGKTHILKAINTAFWPIALYVSVRDFEQKMHEYRKRDDLDVFYETFSYAPILLLDDVGMEHGGKLMVSMVEKIVDARYEMWPEGALVTATNILPKDFPDYIPRASDRILDRRITTPLAIEATTSFRKLEV